MGGGGAPLVEVRHGRRLSPTVSRGNDGHERTAETRGGQSGGQTDRRTEATHETHSKPDNEEKDNGGEKRNDKQTKKKPDMLDKQTDRPTCWTNRQTDRPTCSPARQSRGTSDSPRRAAECCPQAG
eukprot:Selendium_serpulae@DN12118_c0_g1_i1.p2